MEQIKLRFPAAARLCEAHEKVILRDVRPPVEITFLEGISAGMFGAVVVPLTSLSSL